MANGNLKVIKLGVPEEFDKLIEKLISIVAESGYPARLKKTEVLRLLLHYNPSRKYLNKALEEIVNGFNGIKRINPEVEKWMKGVSQ